MKKFKGSFYHLIGHTFEAVIFWPHDKGWWDNYNVILLAKIEAKSTLQATLEAYHLFICAISYKVIDHSDLPLFISWPYVSTEMVKLLKGERLDLYQI